MCRRHFHKNIFMTKKPSISIFLDRYHPNKAGLCALSIRITFNRIRRFYPTSFRLTPKEFDNLYIDKPTKKSKEVMSILKLEEGKAIQIIENLRIRFSFELFDKQFTRKYGDIENVFYLLKEREDELIKEDRISTAVTFKCAINSLKTFHKSDKLLLDEVSVDFLNKYKKWIL